VRTRRVLALRALGLGDLLTGLPALRALRDAFPGHELVLAAPPALEPLARLSGAVDALAPTLPLAPLDPCLTGVEVAVNLHGRGPESHRLLAALRPGRLIAFAHPAVPDTAGAPRWRPDEHEVPRWCRLLAEAGIPADPERLELSRPAVPAPALARGATLLHPGAASAARRWPPERFAAVARAERARGRDVVVTGAPDERALAADVAARAGLPRRSVLAGETDLRGLAALVGAAGRVVCGDTGVAHLATALGTPSVVLFGPTPPALWGPPECDPRHRTLWAGRRGDPHGRKPDPGLLAIEVDDVLAVLAELDRPGEVAA
jgi:ADP-heptose:LPS heptosyltransferase